MPAKVFWTRQAREDLAAVRAFIARDAPATASAFVRRLRISVGRLREFPLSGQIVPGLSRNDIREILYGSYRIIYRVSDRRVDVLTVYHSARLLDDSSI